MLDSLKARLSAARAAVQEAQEHIVEVTEHSPERMAVKRLDETHAELTAAELAVTRDELVSLDAELRQALQRKSALLRAINRQFTSVLVDLQALDELEAHGSLMASRAFNLALDSGGELRSGWRDPVLPGVSHLLSNWLARLRKLEA